MKKKDHNYHSKISIPVEAHTVLENQNTLKIWLVGLLLSCFFMTSLAAHARQQTGDVGLADLLKRGVQEYGNSNYKDAIVIWESVLEKAEATKNTELFININTNIGAAYNALGYHKTALIYFLKTDKLLEQNDESKEENYWINYINIGVSYLSLEQYDEAKMYFDKTADYNDHVMLLKYLNLAQWHADKNDQNAFFDYKIKIDKAILKYPVYELPWLEMQLENITFWKDIPRLKALLEQLKPLYAETSLNLKLAFNEGYFLLNKQLYESIDNLLAYSEEVMDADNYSLKEMYYSLLKDYYLQENNFDRFVQYNKLTMETMDERYREKNMLYVEDFRTALALEDINDKYKEAQLNNDLIKIELEKSTLRFQLLTFLSVMGVAIILLLILNRTKQKKINKLLQKEYENKLENTKLEKVELSDNLKVIEDELNTSMIHIKKIKLLKKQLDDITKGILDTSDEETIKQIKLTLNAFFSTYLELDNLINTKFEGDKTLRLLIQQCPSLKERELKVINLVLLGFTTKEIALLISKSEKSVEYTRTQIRKKLDVDSTDTLEDFLSSVR